MNQALLEVKNLSVQFAADGQLAHAVKGISFKLAAGELLAIVGESGSGKSVTSLAMMQLLPKQAVVKGQLLFSPDGKEVKRYKAATTGENKIDIAAGTLPAGVYNYSLFVDGKNAGAKQMILIQ